MAHHQCRYDIISGVMTSSVALWHIISAFIKHHHWRYDKSSVVLSHIISGVTAYNQWCYETSLAL